jgi:nitrite reductase/ring-hydroxylating ferredoxin subunit
MGKRWIKIAEVPEELAWQKNGLCEVEVEGRRVCFARKGNDFFACANKCPHASGRLSDGYLDALGNIVCPLHRYKFALLNGRNVSGEGYFLRTWKVEVRPDGVFVEM